MKVLVTGGTGRIGANLSVSLLAKGHDVRCFVYPGDASRAGKLAAYDRVEVVEGDLRSLDDVRRAVQGVDAVYHLAAAFGGPYDNLQYLNVNGMGTLNILESVRSDLPSLHRLVYASTEAVYWRLREKGRYFEEPITEGMVSRYKQMPYFLTKWVGEELCMTYHHQYGVPTTVLRFATVMEPGEFLNEDGLPARFLFGPAYEQYRDATADGPEEEEMLRELRSLWTGEDKLLLSRNPNGRPYKQEFADVRDIVQGLTLALEKDAAVGEEFTIGGVVFRWEEVVPYLADRYGIGYVDARLPEWNYFEFDLSKIESLLGYRPRHDVHSIIETAEAMRRGEETAVIPTGIRYGGHA
jgi:UDP-glucose 4-epimerase